MGCVLSTNKSVHDLHLNQFDACFKPWSHVLSLPIEEVDGVMIEEFGLWDPLNLTTRKARMQPWCLQGRHLEAYLPAPIDSLHLDVKYVYDELLIKDTRGLQETRITLQESYVNKLNLNPNTCPFLDTANVIGVRDNTAVVQVMLKHDKCLLLIVDLHASLLTGKYDPVIQNKLYLMECFISPDNAHILLKPNFYFCRRYQIDVSVECLVLIAVQTGIDEIQDIPMNKFDLVSKHFQNNAMDISIAFDPRFKWSRVAVSNVLNNRRFKLLIYCLSKKTIIKSTDIKVNRRIHNLCFSPFGTFIATLIVIPDSTDCQSIVSYSHVMIYASHNLDAVYQISVTGFTSVSAYAPESIFPIFSACGHHLITGKGNGKMLKSLEIFTTPIEINLKHLCRTALTTALDSEQINNLSIDESLRNFILFKPYME